MKKVLFHAAAALLLSACGGGSLKNQIANDERFAKVEAMCLALVQTGFNAGSSYNEVWIRDYNTFIELSMEVMPDSLIRHNLNMFFAFQQDDGNIPDGFIPISQTDIDGEETYKYRLSKLAPDYAAHKNTVETDQETSLVQAIGKYIRKSGNKDYLKEVLYGETVYQRMQRAMEYLINEKTDKQRGLLTGATTVDWGDVQPEHSWGVEIDQNTHYTIDIYDNAMFVLALNDMIDFTHTETERNRWQQVRDDIKKRVREHLWDEQNQKFRPHIYLGASPFPADFDENKIYYHGGTAVACLAGILTKEEVKAAYERMVANQKAAHAQTIGLTVYPTYPAGYFQNRGMYPYGYQNGGDWTWFGARMVHALAQYGLMQEAYDALCPMLQRIIDNDGFYEWYTPAGEPMGSGTFRGEAGVLHKAISLLRQ